MPSPVRAQTYDFTVSLVDSGNRPYFRVNPTLATGDAQISKDEGPLGNLTQLPTVTPAGSVLAHVSLTATEMDAENVVVVFRDVSGAQWDDLLIEISTQATAVTLTPVPADGVAVWSGLDLLKASLRKIGVLAAGETPDAAMTTDGLGELNRLLEGWNIQSGMAHTTTLLSYALSGGQTAVTIGPGGDINTPRPVRFTSGYTRVNNLDVPLTFLGQSEYDALPYKSTLATTWPTLALYEADVPVGTLRLFPPPSGSPTLFLSADYLFQSFATPAQTASFPPGYADAAIYELGARLAFEYNRSVDALYLRQQQQAMKFIKRQNRQSNAMTVDPVLLGRGRSDDQWITHGGYR